MTVHGRTSRKPRERAALVPTDARKVGLAFDRIDAESARINYAHGLDWYGLTAARPMASLPGGCIIRSCTLVRCCGGDAGHEVPLHIQRVQVDAGFLDGLDLQLIPGLNVLFGARGTGKTSVIELIRFALGAKGYTADSTKRSVEHARSILGDGQVKLTLQSESGSFVVTRSAREEKPRGEGPVPLPVIFSQTEIESVGLHSSGRLRLVDNFLTRRDRAIEREEELAAHVRSLTEEIATAIRELGQLDEQLKDLPEVNKAFAAAKENERATAKGSAEIASKNKKLEELSAESAANAVAVSFVERFVKTTGSWLSPLENLQRSGVDLEDWEDGDRDDPIASFRPKFEAVTKKLGAAADDLRTLQRTARRSLDTLAESRLELDEKARTLRKEIEALRKGAGEAAKRSAALNERKAKLVSLQKLRAERQKKLSQLQVTRGKYLDDLDSIRQQRFEQRKAVADKLTTSLAPRIRVGMLRAGLYDEYARQIAEALRGSGLRYTDIAAELSEAMSPRELLEAAEGDDIATVAESTSMARDRVARILAQLREHGMSDLATCPVEDEVNFQLLDGTEYKEVSDLSTGQRCTVILPMVLAHDDRVVIVDQPEDHIDNAFIADTVIKAIKAKAAMPQIIFSTHNANIPVLGEAARVVQMGSDGRRGFVLMCNELDHPDAVKAITDVMEGGRRAFETRAKFYARHGK